MKKTKFQIEIEKQAKMIKDYYDSFVFIDGVRNLDKV